jgi:hypothetical protein
LHDRLRDLTADTGDGERTDVVTLENGPGAKSVGDIGTGIDADLAANAVRTEDEADDEVVVANRSRG